LPSKVNPTAVAYLLPGISFQNATLFSGILQIRMRLSIDADKKKRSSYETSVSFDVFRSVNVPLDETRLKEQCSSVEIRTNNLLDSCAIVYIAKGISSIVILFEQTCVLPHCVIHRARKQEIILINSQHFLAYVCMYTLPLTMQDPGYRLYVLYIP
jgi:hypothetical protein